jgi:hypothetical protein
LSHFVRKGPHTITNHDNPTAADELFSHPVTHRSPQNGPAADHRPAYDNLFREPDLPPVPDTEYPVRSTEQRAAQPRRTTRSRRPAAANQ